MKLSRLGASAAALALLLTAGCGADGGGSATADGSDLTKANFASKVVDAQTKAETAHLEAKIGAQGQEISMAGDMDMAKDDVAFDLTLSGAALNGDAQIILVDQVMYLQIPGLSQGGKFVKIDISKSNHPAAAMFEQMLSQLDPSKTFQAFDAITKLEQNGTEEIDGVETTKYTVTVDTRKALEAQGFGDQVPQGKLPKTIEYDVWVDADDLVRRLQTKVQGSTVDLNLSQWGESVDIAAPPAGKTTEMPQMGAPTG